MIKLLTLKVIIIIVNIIIAGISITSLYTVASGNFNVILPEQEDISWEVRDGELIFTTNVTIQNGGLYSIKDLSIDIDLIENKSGYRLIEYHHLVEDIPGQTDHLESLEVSLDLDRYRWLYAELDKLVLDEQLEAELNKFIFNDTIFNIIINVEAYYTMKLVRFYADYTLEFLWPAPIKAYDIDLTKIIPYYDGTEVRFEIPYRLHTSDLLTGIITIDAHIRSSENDISNTTEIVPLGVDHSGILSIYLDPDNITNLLVNSQMLYLDIHISSSDIGIIYSDTMRYDWVAPLESLTLGKWSIDDINNILSVPISFTNYLPQGFELEIMTSLFDVDGISIGNVSTSINARSGEFIEEVIDIPYSGSEMSDSMEFIFFDLNTGAKFTVNIELGQT